MDDLYTLGVCSDSHGPTRTDRYARTTRTDDVRRTLSRGCTLAKPGLATVSSCMTTVAKGRLVMVAKVACVVAKVA